MSEKKQPLLGSQHGSIQNPSGGGAAASAQDRADFDTYASSTVEVTNMNPSSGGKGGGFSYTALDDGQTSATPSAPPPPSSNTGRSGRRPPGPPSGSGGGSGGGGAGAGAGGGAGGRGAGAGAGAGERGTRVDEELSGADIVLENTGEVDAGFEHDVGFDKGAICKYSSR